MDERKMRRNILIYKIYFVFKDPWFWGVILVSTLMNLAHMSLKEVYVMESVVMLGFMFFEIPSGALADTIGRKVTLLLGCVALLLGTIQFACMDSSFDAWCANIVFMLGISFCSGADKALLSDSLLVLNRRTEIGDIQGKTECIRYIIVAVASLISGWLAEIDLRLPLYFCIPNVALSIIAVSFFTEPDIIIRRTKKAENMKDFMYNVTRAIVAIWRLMIISFVYVKNNKKIKWIILFFTILSTSSKVWFFSYNPYFELVNLNYQNFGYAFCVLNLVAAFFSYNSKKICEKLSEKKSLHMQYLFVALPILYMGFFVSKFSVSMVVFQNVVRGLLNPLQLGMMDVHLSPQNKATIQSISSSARGLSEFIVLATYGLLLDYFGLVYSLQILGVTVLVFCMYGMKKYNVLFT